MKNHRKYKLLVPLVLAPVLLGATTTSTPAMAADQTLTVSARGDHRPAGHELLSLGRCADHEVMIGHGRVSEEELVRCATISIPGAGHALPSGSTEKVGWYSMRTDGAEKVCPENTVVQQRLLTNGRSGQAQVRCTALSFREKGAPEAKAVRVVHQAWSARVPNGNSYSCPKDTVITGWDYHYIINGTSYRCSALVVNR